MKRILITGSREWGDQLTIFDALLEHGNPVTDALVSGACPRGADRLAEEVWEMFGGQVERHPANWDQLGKKAGIVRNSYMVSLGADICLAFIQNNSPGATHCANTAEAAGIPTIRFRS